MNRCSARVDLHSAALVAAVVAAVVVVVVAVATDGTTMNSSILEMDSDGSVS